MNDIPQSADGEQLFKKETVFTQEALSDLMSRHFDEQAARDVVSSMAKRMQDRQHLAFMAPFFRGSIPDAPLIFEPEPYRPPTFREPLAWIIRDNYLPIVRDPFGIIRIDNIGRAPLVLPRRPRSKKKRIQKKWRKYCEKARREYYS